MPLEVSIQEQSDAGVPITVASPKSRSAEIYVDIARRVWEEVQALRQAGDGAAAAPKFTVE